MLTWQECVIGKVYFLLSRTLCTRYCFFVILMSKTSDHCLTDRFDPHPPDAPALFISDVSEGTPPDPLINETIVYH
ncbi:hypothetical protein CFP56_031053 [Quercus suber]|uniref:Uncharacterized protein n=1 Tax=Quercus suber TaxID=58331 RepID=A0AAW0LTI3_QUESU